MTTSWIATTCLQRPPFWSLIFKNCLWTATTCKQRPQIWGPEGGRWTHVWLYFVFKNNLLVFFREKGVWATGTNERMVSVILKGESSPPYLIYSSFLYCVFLNLRGLLHTSNTLTFLSPIYRKTASFLKQGHNPITLS